VTFIQPKTLLALLWMAVPARMLLSSLWAVIRRARLRREPLEVIAVITGVETSTDGAIATLQLRYTVDDRRYTHATTRMDNQRVGYCVGGTIDLVCQQDAPANVMDAAKRPWDDVIGPVVLGVLLFLAMAWLWLIFIGF